MQPLLQRKKAKRFTYCLCVFVALGIQYAMCMRHIFFRGMPGSKIIFPQLSHKRHDLKKYIVIEYKLCFDFLHKFRLKILSFYLKFWDIFS